MARILVAAIVVSMLVLVPAQTAAAQDATGCQPGQAPRFVLGFADLKAQVGDSMGDPQTCEFPDPNGTGDVHQLTSNGLAFWRKSTNTPTFTNGFDHWALTPDGSVTWTGASVDPPGQPPAQASIAPPAQASVYPDSLINGFMNGCQGGSTDPQREAACRCSINGIQARYSVADFVGFAQRILTDGTLPTELTPIILDCFVGQPLP
jgi:hypothetical protein